MRLRSVNWVVRDSWSGGSATQVVGDAGYRDIRLEQQGAFDQQRMLVVQQVLPQRRGTNSGRITVTYPFGSSRCTRSM